MSGYNPAKTETESRKSENETQNNTDKISSDEAYTKTDGVLPIDKDFTPSKEIVIDILDINSTPDDKTGTNVDYMVDYRATQIKSSQATVIYQVRRQPLSGNTLSGNQPSGNQGYGSSPYGQQQYVMDQQATYGAPLDYDPDSRNGFIRLVFTIVLIMILVTAAFVSIVLFTDYLKGFFQKYGLFIALPATIVMIALNYTIGCSACARKYPCNIICLVLAVIGMSLICGYVTVRYDTRIVLYAVIATCVVILVCIGLAFTRFDFTAWMIYIVVIAAAFSAIFMIVMVTMLLTGTYMKILHLVMLIVSTIISVVVITMELQLILGGKAIELGEEDYALAAFLLYTSIVDVFLKMVQILGICDNM